MSKEKKKTSRNNGKAERERMQLTRDHVPSLCLEYTATAACEYYHMKYTHHTQRVREHTQPERERERYEARDRF
jgi:hypothetical protein